MIYFWHWRPVVKLPSAVLDPNCSNTICSGFKAPSEGFFSSEKLSNPAENWCSIISVYSTILLWCHNQVDWFLKNPFRLISFYPLHQKFHCLPSGTLLNSTINPKRFKYSFIPSVMSVLSSRTKRSASIFVCISVFWS